MKKIIQIAQFDSIFCHIKMLILTFEEFNIKFGIDIEAMSNVKIQNIGKEISVTPIRIVRRDQKQDNVFEPNFKIIVNL